jgi:hypothetical protein
VRVQLWAHWQTFEHAAGLEPKSELIQACVAESRANVEAERKWHNAVQNEAEAREKVSDPPPTASSMVPATQL